MTFSHPVLAILHMADARRKPPARVRSREA
jgi:hypothetical protein